MPLHSRPLLYWLSLAPVAVRVRDARPAWLWSGDDGALLWANTAGARALGATTVAALMERGLPPADTQRRQALQLARRLGPSDAPRLERLRGFGAWLGGLVTCECRRIEGPEGEACLLITGLAPLAVSESERNAGLFADSGVARDTVPSASDPAPEAVLPAPALAETEHESDRAPEPMTPPPARTLPLRFMWSSDADGRFTLQSEDFAKLLGPRTASGLDRPWSEMARALDIDSDNGITQAFASQRTFNGTRIDWPTDDPHVSLPVELSGVPFYDSGRAFAGFRGFGLVRDLDALSKRDASLAAPAAEQRDADIPVKPNELSAAATPTEQLVAQVIAPAEEPVIEPPANVVPFRSPQTEIRPTLSAVENSAFNELARQLSARLDDNGKAVDEAPVAEEPAPEPAVSDPAPDNTPAWLAPQAHTPSGTSQQDVTLIDRIPTGMLIYRLDRLLYANPAFLAQVGYPTLTALADAGGLDALYVEPGVPDASSTSDTGTPVRVSSERGDNPPADAALHTIAWDGEQAMALIFALPRPHIVDAPLPVAAQPVVAVPEPEPSPPPPPPEPVVMAEPDARLQRQIERTADVKADVLARISHEVRTPLNAIIGFADVMISERFGALGNERYVEYLKDIRASGERVITIIDDMLDLSHIETGKLDLTFANQNLNDLVEQCVGVMQPQANRERIIIRTALARALPWISADARALRQIAMNLIGNSIHLANAGGQVIVSTALNDIGDVMLRVRDTGQGLNDNEMATALAPFRAPMSPADVTTANSGVSLSLTKALVEANRAQFQIKSSPQAGTLVEVRFPSAGVKAG